MLAEILNFQGTNPVLGMGSLSKIIEIKKVFSFLEDMAGCEDVKIKEVLDFTVLEQLADEGPDVLERCKQYMREETLKRC